MKYRLAKQSDWKGIKFLISLFPDQLMQDHLPSFDKFFVAEHDNRIVGCCALDIYNRRIGEIRSLAVLPEFQGNGIGTELIELCVKKAQGKVDELITITGRKDLFRGFDTFRNEKYCLFKIL